jgi:GGDEF domain-containing protein
LAVRDHGDEFIVFLGACTPNAAIERAAAIEAALSYSTTIPGVSIEVTASVGDASKALSRGDGVENLLEEADKVMYDRKNDRPVVRQINVRPVDARRRDVRKYPKSA